MPHAQSNPKPLRLDHAEIERRLSALPEWSLSGDQLQRTFVFKDFVVAVRAEVAQHHPDMLVRWNRVTLSLSTHDAGGISEKDFAFALETDSNCAGA